MADAANTGGGITQKVGGGVRLVFKVAVVGACIFAVTGLAGAAVIPGAELGNFGENTKNLWDWGSEKLNAGADAAKAAAENQFATQQALDAANAENVALKQQLAATQVDPLADFRTPTSATVWSQKPRQHQRIKYIWRRCPYGTINIIFCFP